MRSMKNFDAMAQSHTPHFPSFGFGVSQIWRKYFRVCFSATQHG
jgi:hypothetical protein